MLSFPRAGDLVARDLVRKYFADAPDPLPRWADIKALLDAKRKGCEIHSYTFDEKSQFDPANIAKAIVDRNMTTQEERAHLDALWNAQAGCRSVYRDDMQAFLEDVSREKIALLAPPRPAVLPEIEKIVPKNALRDWPQGERGYSLSAIREAVLSVKKHFPNGSPLVGDLKWSKRPSKSLWGFFRFEDKSLSILPAAHIASTLASAP